MDRKLYDTGWDDCIEYMRDRQRLRQSETGLGMPMMLIGMAGLTIGVVAPLMAWIQGVPIVNFQPLVWPFVLGMVFLGAGYVVDKGDAVRHKQREDEFSRKWVQRWKDLDLQGDS